MIVKGEKINDRYEIIRIIGEGGMANVYLAEDTILNRKVAVKVLRGDLANDEKFVRRFQREALSASSLNHPNIVEIYDVGEDDGNFYIVMEYVDGKNLKQIIKRRTKLTLFEVIDIMKQLTDGIAVALNSTQLTQTNSVMGSVHYLPPEQAAGKGATVKSDIYSLGIMMYELITGKLPFKGENAVEIALKQIKEPIPSVREFDPTIPQSVENIILKSCAKNPKNRYNSVREMYNDLCTCLNEDKKDEKKVKYEYPEFEDGEIEAIKDVNEVDNRKEEVDIKKVNKKDKDNKGENKLAWIIGIITSILVVIAVFIFMVLPNILKTPDVKIPDVANKTVVDAEKMLKDLGFNVDVDVKDIYSDTIEEGKIVKTSPEKGRSVKKGTTITMYKSLGTEKIKIEDYAGMNIYEVKAKLELKELKVSIESKDVDDPSLYEDKEDTIIGQSVKEGTLNKGDQIILYYPNIVVYPDLTTYTLQEVQEFADKYDLTLYVDEIETDSVEEGIIISQSRKEKTLIVRGADLTIKIAVKPKEDVPSEPENNTGEDNRENNTNENS